MNVDNIGALVRHIPWSAAGPAELESLLTREWLVTNGLGGHASGTVAGYPSGETSLCHSGGYST